MGVFAVRVEVLSEIGLFMRIKRFCVGGEE